MIAHRRRGPLLYLALFGTATTLFVLRSQSTQQLLGGPAQDGRRTPAVGAQVETSRAATPGGARTVAGRVIQTRYGPVQIAIVYDRRRITDVRALQWPTKDPRSLAASQRALPILHAELLRSQSAKVDTVSGATYTSAGYARSVQSAIDTAEG